MNEDLCRHRELRKSLDKSVQEIQQKIQWFEKKNNDIFSEISSDEESDSELDVNDDFFSNTAKDTSEPSMFIKGAPTSIDADEMAEIFKNVIIWPHKSASYYELYSDPKFRQCIKKKMDKIWSIVTMENIQKALSADEYWSQILHMECEYKEHGGRFHLYELVALYLFLKNEGKPQNKQADLSEEDDDSESDSEMS